MCQVSWNLGASTSWNPQGLSRPVMGLLHYVTASDTTVNNIWSSAYMATCFGPHLGHLRANILYEIDYNCMPNVHVDRMRSQSVLKIQCMSHLSITMLQSLKYVVIWHNVSNIGDSWFSTEDFCFKWHTLTQSMYLLVRCLILICCNNLHFFINLL